jgi:hypothetical protein
VERVCLRLSLGAVDLRADPDIKRGARNPTITVVEKLAQPFGITASESNARLLNTTPPITSAMM